MSAICVGWEPLSVQRGLKRAVAFQEKDIPCCIGGGCRARHPDAAVASIGPEIQATRLRQRVCAEGHDPQGIRTNAAVRRPRGVNRSVKLQEAWPPFGLLWV